MSLGGILEIMADGYGFLRQETPAAQPRRRLYLPLADTALRPAQRRHGDRAGAPAQEGEKYFSLLQVEAINGLDPEPVKGRPPFGPLTPTFPDKHVSTWRTTPRTCPPA